MKAVKIRDLEDYKGHAALYRCEPPLDGHEYVVVSKVNNMTYGFRIHETYAFPADESGEVTDWEELDCSRRGEHSHADVLANAGYTVEF